MSRAYKRAGPPIPHTISDKHASKCYLHGSTDRTPSCAGFNTKLNPCKNTIALFRPGLWPVCGKHAHIDVPAARCQAVAFCGRTCDRLVKADSSFNLCTVHEKGANTLPCYLLKIPTEIRVNIFRRLLPESVPFHSGLRGPDGEESSYAALLRVNKQINGEAAFVLYDQVPFNVKILNREIRICNNKYSALGLFNGDEKQDQSEYSAGKTSLPKAIQRIRNFRISVCFNTYKYLDRAVKGISMEDQHILGLRESIRKFSEALVPVGSTTTWTRKPLISIEVIPRDWGRKQWRADETLAALALATEPLRLTGPVRRAIMNDIVFEELYRPTGTRTPFLRKRHENSTEWFKSEFKKFQSEWASMMESQKTIQSTLGECPGDWYKRALTADIQRKSAEGFMKMIHRIGLTTQHAVLGGTSVFEGLDGIAYLTQLAYEQYNLPALEMIREALKNRLMRYRKETQKDVDRIADSLLQIFARPEERLSMTETQLEASIFPEKMPNKGSSKELWPEMDISEFEWIPGPESRPVSEDRLRRYYLLDPGVRDSPEPLPYCVLKTPRVVRALRGP